MRRQLVFGLSLLLVAAELVAATGEQILLEARDLKSHPLAGLRFSYEEVKSKPTSRTGVTELDLLPKQRTGKQIKIQLAPGSKRTEEWFLVNPEVNIPNEGDSAIVVLMRRSEFRQLAAEASKPTALHEGKLTVEDRRRVLVDTAARYGLTAEQLEAALRSFAETQDPKDKGIAAYLESRYAQAEEYLNKAVEGRESDLVETLRYLGVSQYEQAKYHAAADSFRKALALHGEDALLLSWLGVSLQELAQWAEAELMLRRALAIDEKNFGTDHPDVARDLDNLGWLLQSTNRLAEAERLKRQALTIAEKSLGSDHPDVAIRLNDLAVLLRVTDRFAEAELLLRRALAIDEKRLGTDHRNIAIVLTNLGALLKVTNRMGEAELVMRRALAIHEKTLGTEQPLGRHESQRLGAASSNDEPPCRSRAADAAGARHR